MLGKEVDQGHGLDYTWTSKTKPPRRVESSGGMTKEWIPMASANIAQRTSPRPARKPDPDRILQSYFHICDTKGKRGALRRVGEIYGISHETVRRYVAAHEAALNVPEVPQELQYVPPPRGYDPPIAPLSMAQNGADLRNTDTPNSTETAQTPLTDRAEFMSSGTAITEAGTQESEHGTSETAHDEMAQQHTDELETPMVAATEMAQPVIRERVVIRDRIVRLPADTHQRGIYDRLAGIDATSIMGPELGLIVAAILIAMTFWGLG